MRLEIDLGAIGDNARAVVERCAAHGLRVVGVTKGCCGQPAVARAMLDGGVVMLGDSRLDHVRRMRAAGIAAEMMLLRLPCPSRAEEVVALTEASLNTEPLTVRALSDQAVCRGLTHRVVLMVDVGDRREGVMPDRAVPTAKAFAACPGIELWGVGTNVACLSGVLPSVENSQLLLDVAREVERALGIRLAVVSGGSTATLKLLEQGQLPPGISQLRIGEAILLGTDTAHQRAVPGLRTDAFTLRGEVIELQKKPSRPEGILGRDAMGQQPHFADRGRRWRAIVALGEQDLRTGGLRPWPEGMTIIGASSDHLVVDVTEADPQPAVGSEIAFALDYGAMATGMASMGLQKIVRRERQPGEI